MRLPRVAVDAGHGESNAHIGVYDPGAVVVVDGRRYEEATIALEYALTLRDVLRGRGYEVLMTREVAQEARPLWRRSVLAEAWGADVFISLHLNAGPTTATGSEVEWKDRGEDDVLATFLQNGMLRVTGFRDHGNDERHNLAVLRFKGPAALIELGFLTNNRDRAYLLVPENRWKVCRSIADSLAAWWAAR